MFYLGYVFVVPEWQKTGSLLAELKGETLVLRPIKGWSVGQSKCLKETLTSILIYGEVFLEMLYESTNTENYSEKGFLKC